MRQLVMLAVVGWIAQLVDGSLGMAYGVTSTTLLLTVGDRTGDGLGGRTPLGGRDDARVGRLALEVRQRGLE